MAPDEQFTTMTDFKTLRATTEGEADVKLNKLALEGYALVQMSASEHAVWFLLKKVVRIAKPVMPDVVHSEGGTLLAG